MDKITTDLKLAFLLSIGFFVLAFATLKNYGISWDEPTHFKRGQAYLHYFLTGEKHYSTLGIKNRSFFQNDKQDGEFWMGEIGSKGHPPVNGIIASFLNYIFYQKSNLLGEVEAYHLFNILSASLLVFVVFIFTSEYFGKFPAFVAVLTLSLYPLFWSEAHFNIKDPPEAAFIAATIWAFCKSLSRSDKLRLSHQNLKWLLLTLLFFFLGLGTKFNILFLPLILLPYIYLRVCRDKKPLKFTKLFVPVLVSGIIVSFLFLILLWPSLWPNFPLSLLNVFRFYKDVGTAVNYQPEGFYFLGFNLYPIEWVLFTTPPLVMFLALAGIYCAIRHFKDKNFLPALLILWLIMPILRISLPGTSVYGGIRQALEFLPALAMLAGLGAWQIVSLSKKHRLVIKIAIIAFFIYPALMLYKLHPNENVYFNSLIGGLSGARAANFPSWGNSYGNAYKQGVDWINTNAEFGAKATLLQGELQNVYPPSLRPDIIFSKDNWSGSEKAGEYIMELTFNNTARAFNDKWNYVNKFLSPVYEVKVEEVSILKIWKNDLEHTRQE